MPETTRTKINNSISLPRIKPLLNIPQFRCCTELPQLFIHFTTLPTSFTSQKLCLHHFVIRKYNLQQLGYNRGICNQSWWQCTSLGLRNIKSELFLLEMHLKNINCKFRKRFLWPILAYHADCRTIVLRELGIGYITESCRGQIKLLSSHLSAGHEKIY